MVSTFTPNIQIEEPARGDDIGTWDTPVNNNMTLLDLILGGTVTIGLNNANVVLATAQFRPAIITFNSTLTGSVAITFPTSFVKTYTIQHLCTGSSAFTITLNTTAAGGQQIACPPGQPFDIINDGVNIKFKNFGPHIGGYWDYCGSSVPNWVSGCSVAPYLNTDGTAFSSATFPLLAQYLGGTNLPDFRGRLPGYLNQGTGRITSGSSTGGVDGNTLLSAGGSQTTTLSSQNAPPIPITDPGHTHQFGVTANVGIGGGPPNPGWQAGSGTTITTSAAFTGITAGNASPTNFSNLPPMTIGGLRLIRAG